MMKYSIALYAALLSCGMANQATAADFDGRQPLVCAAVQSFECETDAECEAAKLEDINVPRFLRLSFNEKVIRSKRPNGDVRTTPIEFQRDTGDRLILHGTEQGEEGIFGWDMVIAQADGRMTLAIAGNALAVVVFGACTPVDLTGK